MTETLAETALTPEQLAASHRAAQTRVRAQALRDMVALWPIWQGDQQSFGLLVQALLPLVYHYRSMSATLAASYYQASRSAEQVAGPATVRLADQVPADQVTASLYVTGLVQTRDALAAGQPAAQARAGALTRVSGAATRHILGGGRQTILDSVAADRHALGWARVTDGNPCAFCLTLASRGAVYKSEQSADFRAHDHCACAAMPVFDRAAAIPNLDRWRGIYDDAQNEGEQSGTLNPGANSSKARIGAVRAYLTAHPEA